MVVQKAWDVVFVILRAVTLLDEIPDHGACPNAGLIAGSLWTILDDRHERFALTVRKLVWGARCLSRHKTVQTDCLVP